MACETETVTVKVKYFVDAEMSSVNRFGPMSSLAQAEALLLVLSARGDVKKATLIREVEDA